MIVVAYSSPLRYLIVFGEHRLLPELFGDVWVPSTVLDELSAASTPDSVRQFLHAPPPWLNVRDPGDDSLQDVVAELDRGERAALALARELHADLVLLDDAAARHEATSLGLRITGTIGLLRLAAERGLIDVRATVAKLRTSGFYVTDSLIHAAFREWL
jgi:predicted nucleic acid-binding protein